MNKQDTIAGVDVGGTYTDLIVFDQSGKLGNRSLSRLGKRVTLWP